jgi:hypothetical protein
MPSQLRVVIQDFEVACCQKDLLGEDDLYFDFDAENSLAVSRGRTRMSRTSRRADPGTHVSNLFTSFHRPQRAQ